jgi:hypothetical protein
LLAAIVLIFPASYHRNLYDILVPILILIHSCHNAQLNHGVRCLANPCRHQDDEKNYTMAQVAS